MRVLISSISVVAVAAILVFFRGSYGAAHVLWLLTLLGFLLRSIGQAGSTLQLGPQSGPIVVFWLNVMVFAIPAFGLYLARRSLREGYVIAVSAWTMLYLWSLLYSGRLIDWP